jgi:cob(I)alamin adenosyltransferase
MSKIYTKTGDKGLTGLVSGRRVLKSDLRLECYGTVDELNSALGMVRSSLESNPNLKKEFDEILNSIQNELFNIGSRLSCDDGVILTKLPNVSDQSITFMESHIDRMTKDLPELKNFILPGGNEPASILQWSRTVCRRAERLTVKLAQDEKIEALLIQYLNRLSDFLFVMARFANHKTGRPDILWKK